MLFSDDDAVVKVTSNDSINSEQPKDDYFDVKKNYKYKHVKAKVDSSPPYYTPILLEGRLRSNAARHRQLTKDNMALVNAILLSEPKVDSRWQRPLQPQMRYFDSRVNFLKKLPKENRRLNNIFCSAPPKIVTTQSLLKDWSINRKRILKLALKKFILFPPVVEEIIEDPLFKPPAGLVRTRLLLHLRIQNGCSIGSLPIELLSDICPATCHLFLELLMADPKMEYSYIGTKFFRKIPEYMWSGGDVVYDDGSGCYAQKGRTVPIGAENYRLPHSMPGLLTMPVTKNDELCGIFRIVFKPLSQLDFKNICFGRVIRPSEVFDGIRRMGTGNSLNPRPHVILNGYTIVK